MARSRHPALFVVATTLLVTAQAASDDTAAFDELRIPDGYRTWQLIAPAEEAAPLNELRAVLGNPIAVEAARAGTLPYPDGAVLVKLAWQRVPSPSFAPASIPGRATTVQVMVKDAARYAGTGGWGFGRFVGGELVDRKQHATCLPCHRARVSDNDLVFTRYAP